jgi:outer membrane lipase/esterase
MKPNFLSRWMGGLAASMVFLLAGCGGGGSTYDPFVPARIIGFGDAFSVVDSSGFAVNTVRGTSTTTDDSVIGRIAAYYGKTVVASTSSTQVVGATANVSFAANQATISTVVTQINNFLSTNTVSASDLYVITVGTWDIYNARAGSAAVSDIPALVSAIQSLTSRGATHVVVMGPINLTRTPWANANSFTNTGLIWGAGQNTSFNDALSTQLSAVYTQDRKPVLFNTQYLSFYNNIAGTYPGQLSLLTNSITDPQTPACASSTPNPNPPTGLGCAVADATNYTTSTFADGINLTPYGNRLMADNLIAMMRPLGWVP